MKKLSFCLVIFTIIAVLCSCSTTETIEQDVQISVFEDYDSLISLDNGKLQIVEDLPVERIILCTKGEELFGTVIGSFPTAIVKTALKNIETDYVINVVSSKVIEFSTKDTVKPEFILDSDTQIAAQSCDILLITDDFSKIPVESFQIPSVFMSTLNLVSIYGLDGKINVIIDVKDESLAKTVFILMKAGLVANSKLNGEEIDLDNVSSLIERIDNRIYLYNLDFDINMIKENFVSPF